MSRFKNNKKYPKRNDRKPSYESRRKNCDDQERPSEYKAYSRENDPMWYAQNQQLLKDTASLPYSWPLGNRLNLGQYGSGMNNASIPGIFAIHTAPTFGYSDNANSPINIAARNIYSFVRHANSGHANYDAIDQMQYLMAMDSLYSFHAFMRRIYGVVQTYSYTNRYYPVAICAAMGVDYYDVQEHLADFRAWINAFAVKVGSMVVPASMSYFAKHIWMYEGMYLDSAQDKAQTYLFVPDGFYRFTLDGDLAGKLEYRRLMKMDTSYTPTRLENRSDSTLLKSSELFAYGNSMLDPILQSEDFNIMSGDILKAFGSSNLYMISSIPENYTVLPQYKEEVLDQIQNLSMIGRFADDKAELVQDKDKGYLVFTPNFRFPYQFTSVKQSAGENYLFSSKIVTFEHGNVEPAMTMEATRMTQICSAQDEDKLEWTYKTLASEVAMYGYIYSYTWDKDVWALTRSRTIHTPNTSIVDPSADTSTMGVTIIEEFTDQAVPQNNKPMTGNYYQTLAPTAAIKTPAINPETILKAFGPALTLSCQISQFNRHPAITQTFGVTSGGAVTTTKVYIRYGNISYPMEAPSSPGQSFTHDGSGYSFKEVESEPGKVTPYWSTWDSILLDVNYYTIVSEETLKNLAQTALLSMFNITQYGRIAG